MKYKILIENLDCANCANELKEEIEKEFKIENVNVDFISQTVLLDIDEKRLDECIKLISNFEEVKVKKIESFNMNLTTLKIEGLDCTNCARELEEELNKIDGIESNVDFMNMSIRVKYSNQEALNKAIYTINHFEECKVVDEKNNKKESIFKEHKLDIIRLIVSTILFIIAFTIYTLFDSTISLVFTYIIYILAYLVISYPVLINTVKNISKGLIFDENFLMSIASIGAMVLGVINKGDGFQEGVIVMILYELGELLQEIAVGRSRNSITSLMELKSESATLYNNNEMVIVKPEDLKIDDRIIIKVGEKFPVDVVVTEGETSIDMKSLNGESLPKDIGINDEVLSGSINLTNAVIGKVIRVYNDSAVKKILDLVENSTSKRSKNEKFITKFAKYYTPIVCILAIVVATIIPTISGLINGFEYDIYASWIYKALNFLVISCPCALVISVPLSYFGGIGKAARKGILVKGSTSLDEIATADIIAFDKTGTLTVGTFEIINSSNDEALKYATALEKYSKHPIALSFGNKETSYEAKDVKEYIGKGLIGKVNEDTIYVGNEKLLNENGIKYYKNNSVSTVIYVARNKEYIGYIEIDDVIKHQAKDLIKSLKEDGIKKTVLLSGDSQSRAEHIKDELGLDEAKGNLLPQEKIDEANKLKEFGKLIYVGDGVNDAPVMTISDSSISMGKIGSDAAIEASDIVLISDNLGQISEIRKISKKTRRIVFENIIGALFVKFLIMILDLTWGLMFDGANFPMIASIFADVGVMLLCVLNSMRLMKK